MIVKINTWNTQKSVWHIIINISKYWYQQMSNECFRVSLFCLHMDIFVLAIAKKIKTDLIYPQIYMYEFKKYRYFLWLKSKQKGKKIAV